MATNEEWRPMNEELQQVILLLQHSQSPDTQTQSQVQQVFILFEFLD